MTIIIIIDNNVEWHNNNNNNIIHNDFINLILLIKIINLTHTQFIIYWNFSKSEIKRKTMRTRLNFHVVHFCFLFSFFSSLSENANERERNFPLSHQREDQWK